MTILLNLKKKLSAVENTEKQLKRYILSLLLLRTFLYATLVVLMSFFKTKGTEAIMPELPVSIGFVALVTVFTAFSVFIIQNASFSLKKTGVLQLFADTFLIAACVYGTGCSQSIFTPIFIVPIIAGGLILYRTGGLISATSATILYGFILLLEYAGVTPGYFANTIYQKPTNLLTIYNLFAVHGVIFFVFGLISGQMAGRIRQTEKKLSQTSLEYDRLSILYKQIFDDIATGIITTNQQGRITSYNNASERITGYPKEKILGQSFSICFPEIQFTQHNERNVCTLIKADKSEIRVGFSFSRLNMPVNANEHEEANWRVITLQDISKIESMERKMREAEKMATIGELSASIAHDFRNPLAAISGSAQILAMEDDTSRISETQRTLVGIIKKESNRMAKTITDFLQFARPAEVVSEWFNANRLIEEVLAELKPQYTHLDFNNITKETDAHFTCWGDRQQLHTVLKHLLENAFNAIDYGNPDAKTAIRAIEIEQENDVFLTCIEVCDTGSGIAEDAQEKVFAPFYSTREDGTGLGLSIVRQIVENHKGSIKITRDQNYSCIIQLLLPTPSTYRQPVQ